MRPIDEKTKKEFARIKRELDNGLYEKYLNGDISFTEISVKLNIKYSYLNYYFVQNNIKSRVKVLNETTQHDFFEKIDNEIKAYLLGYFYADGSLDENKNRISISQTEKDLYIIELFKEYIGRYYKISSLNCTKERNGYCSKPMKSITIHSEKIVKDLIKKGITKRKTYFPLHNIDFVPDELKIHFIRGYFDGDGTVYSGIVNHKRKNKIYQSRNYNWNIISHNKEHLVLLQEFLKTEYQIKTNVISDIRGNFLLSITSKENFKKMRDVLYENANFFLKRKYEKYMTIPC